VLVIHGDISRVIPTERNYHPESQAMKQAGNNFDIDFILKTFWIQLMTPGRRLE
jgi:hypothetical protein